MRLEDSGPSASATSGTRDADAERLRPGGQERGVAAAAMAEREVRAARQMPRAEARVQHVGHELLGRDQGERVVERQLVDQPHAVRGQHVGPLGGQRQPERRVVGAEMLARVRLEGQHRQRHVRPGAMRGAQQVGVAEMHAIEIAERDAGAAGVVRQAGQWWKMRIGSLARGSPSP